LTGFDNGEIDQILIGNGKEGLTDQDAVPEVGDEPITKEGDLWVLGDHRLICGDSTNIEHVNRLMAGQKADIVFTDPPYGVSIGKKNRFLQTFQKSGRNTTDIVSDDMKPEELKDKILIPAFVNLRSILADNATVFLTAPQNGELGMMMMMMMKEAGLPVRHVLIWKKNSPTFSMGRLDYDYQHEPILLTWGKKHEYYGAKIVAEIPFTLSARTANAAAHVQNLNIGYTCSGTANLRFLVKATGGTLTTASANTYTFRAKYVQTN